MRWQGRRESTNIEDRRRASSSSRGLPFAVGGKGKIALFIVVLVAGYYGVDLSPLLNNATTAHEQQQQQVNGSPEMEQAATFTSVILASTEDSWAKIFKQTGKAYTPPKLVMYTNTTHTSCGVGQAIMGPFYCPADKTVYIDLGFYQQMKSQLGGGGDFAQAYVIAHEVGHHVQNLLGTADKISRLQQQTNEQQANKLSVALELQADCYAGVWGASLKGQNILETGDLESALRTAQAIGDDALQKQSQGYVVPDSFTHGTSEQRYTWFKRGFDSADINQCDTFN